MNFSIVNLGCKVNRVESDSFGAYLISQNCIQTNPSEANLILINTCTVTGDAEKKTRKAVRRALNESLDAQVVVTGCAAAINPEYFEQLNSRVRVVSKQNVESFLVDYLNEQNNLGNHIVDSDSFESLSKKRIGLEFPTRVAVKIQDGCNHSCTYCIVHVARGKAWSRSSADIIREAIYLESQGVTEIVLTGIDLGSYRFDGLRLSGLLRELLKATSTVRFRISSIEPCSIESDLPQIINESHGRICKHLHLPLQSGSNKVLREMNRPYSREYFLDLCSNLRKQIPNLSLSTDCIVGFPGETVEEFQETCEVAKLVHFSKIHVFRYSQREGTPAAKRSDQISFDEKCIRSKYLSELGDGLRLSFAQSLVGNQEKVVVEKKGWGMTESYFHVRVPDNFLPGSVHLITLNALDSQGVFLYE